MKPPNSVNPRLAEETLRQSEFAFIDFRDSAAGRQAYVQGSTLAVWEVMLLVRSYAKDVSAVSRHLRWPEAKVQAAVNYANAFSQEINAAIAENDAIDFESLKRMLPQAFESTSQD
jgi:predicted transcriptional regulator